MNERIKELLTQAGFSFDENGELNTLAAKRVEKFAELIVSECARVADQWVDDEDNGHNLVSERLRQHFGVES